MYKYNDGKRIKKLQRMNDPKMARLEDGRANIVSVEMDLTVAQYNFTLKVALKAFMLS